MDTMNPVNDSKDQAKKANKRSIDQMTIGNENKKNKLFSAKIFRKQLNQEHSHAAVKQFLEAVNTSRNHDYIMEYLENGGSCLELLQTLELDSSIPPLIIFELLSHILLRINATCPQYKNAACEACRYMLNNYATVFGKMINLSSTTPERKACLKLLTAIVALSSNLAKEILIHINFHSTNIELLTKHTGEKNNVRDHFIRFLTAFLMDDHYPALSVVLEKKGFLTSILKGLQFDSADTLCLVISAMKNNILENPLVSKTAKMKTFHTVVVRDIVNLYNWKGPAAMSSQKNNKTVIVDQSEKIRVNECIHDFLLVLCTSHKFGVIFRDPLVGLGKKNQNALMYTVLESLDRPWDHSYASDLVIKISGACPDLAKTVWNNLKQYLVPRMSEKWLSAMKFAERLIQEQQPCRIELCLKKLSVTQVFQVVQCLVSPLPVIKTILPENNIFESPAIKLKVISLLSEILKSLNSYLSSLNTFLSVDDQSKLKSLFNNFISKNFYDCVTILKDYQNHKDTHEYSQIEFLEVAFDIFEQYKILSPILLDSLGSENFDLSEILKAVENIADEKEIDTSNLKVKMINIFIALDNSKFLPHTPLFSLVVLLLFRKYYNDSDENTSVILNKLMKNSGIFEECNYEIDIWINAILNLKKFDESVILNIIDIMKITAEHSQEFLVQLYSLHSDSRILRNYSHVLQTILDADTTNKVDLIAAKHRYLSPMVLGLLKFTTEKEVSKNLKIYANFALINLLHVQTRPDSLVQIIEKFDFSTNNLNNYVTAWRDVQEIVALPELKGKLDVFRKFSREILLGSVDDLIKREELNLVHGLLLSLLDATIFYISNLLDKNILSTQIVENSKKFVKYLVDKKAIDDVFIERLLNNPVLLYNITFLSPLKDESANIGTQFIVDIIKELIESGYEIENYMEIYRRKIVHAVIKILKKPHKYEEVSTNIKELLQLFSLKYDDCCSILNTISLPFDKYCKYSIVYDILVFSLNQLNHICQINSNLTPLNEKVVHNLSQYLILAANHQEIDLSNFSTEFLLYLETFPHNLKNVDEKLFQALMEINDFNKENIKLAGFLIQKNMKHMKYVINNIGSICEKKGILLSLLGILIENNIELEELQTIYDRFEKSLTKALQKPQKAGQHFHKHYEGLLILVEKCMPNDICEKFWEKTQKFEVTEIFHANLLSVICMKSLNNAIDAKKINNIIMTFVHLQANIFKRGLKTKEEITKAKSVALIFDNIMKRISTLVVGIDLKNTAKNETVKLYCKYCLKFGISGEPVILKSLSSLLRILYSSMEVDDGRMILEMLLSHSEVLGAILGKPSELKLEILSLFLDLCENWPEFMERNHIPVLLAGYGAMVNKCDKILMKLFAMYESKSAQTKFYDFHPFLWGKAAATHYSVKLQIENALWRQPKTGDVLEILQDDCIRATLINYPLNDRLEDCDMQLEKMADAKCYDLMFLMPLFSQLLAPEQQVQTYKFTRSGALSLTVVALSSEDEEVRQMAFYILSQFYYHMEARMTGKDNILWLRYVEAVCKGAAVLPGFRLNNFAAIYLARMALILTQSNHVMYLPLSQYLLAKSSPDFSTVPELYTFLHSPDVNFKEHRMFALELLRDGLRTGKDFTDFSRSMAFKLFSELYSSSASDSETRLAILEVVSVVSGMATGAKQLCESHSFLTQLVGWVGDILMMESKDGQNLLLMKNILGIMVKMSTSLQDKHSNLMLFDILRNILSAEKFESYLKNNESVFLEIVYTVHKRFPNLFSEQFVMDILRKASDPFSNYIFKYGCDFLDVRKVSDSNDKYRFLRLVMIDVKRSSKNC